MSEIKEATVSRPPKGILRWEEPPIHGNNKPKRPLKYQDAADALRRRPGRWGVVAVDLLIGTCGTLSHRIRVGLGPWAPAGSYESRMVGPVGGKGMVYARYVGEPSS